MHLIIDAIKQQFGNNKNFSITDNGDGSFLVSMNDTQRMYYIDETGKIIDKILKISTADELKSFRDDVNSDNTYKDWYVYLANDITLDINEEWEPIGIYQEDSTNPDDETNIPFKGISVYSNVLIENCYNVGNLKATTLALSINCSGNSLVTFKNNYYLENTVNGSNDIYPQEECKVKNSQEMKKLYSVLGKAYEEDTSNINNGYPILNWQ